MTGMDIVRIGVVGLGNMGKTHCSCINELEGAKLTAVCDVSEDRLMNLKPSDDFDHNAGGFSLTDDVDVFSDYNEMIESGSIDLVLIAVPHYFHPEMAINAFKKGIHVICEKPVAITAREACLMNEAFEKSNVVFAAMFQQRTVPTYIKIKEMIEDGTLGEIRRVSWIITDWFRTQAYYNSGGWRGNWTGEGGGVLMNQCPHNLDLFQWFFGLPKTLTAYVYCGKWHDITVEDDVSVLMEMENGATASFITTTGDTPGTNRLEITADNGKLVHEDEKLLFYKTEQPVQEILDKCEKGFYSSSAEKVEVEIPPKPSGHRYIIQNTVNNILGKEDLIAFGIDGIKSVQLANAMLYSGLKKKQVQFPVCEDEFDNLLEELRNNERKYYPDKTFSWESYLQKVKD